MESHNSADEAGEHPEDQVPPHARKSHPSIQVSEFFPQCPRVPQWALVSVPQWALGGTRDQTRSKGHGENLERLDLEARRLRGLGAHSSGGLRAASKQTRRSGLGRKRLPLRSGEIEAGEAWGLWNWPWAWFPQGPERPLGSSKALERKPAQKDLAQKELRPRRPGVSTVPTRG
jgi:hypothetical protein